ncbi:hypothetical protein HMN09_00210700 [Mycena chlorophos]|uniref:Uncharacterized protein n=1 Tax=Mycena chlorophos TaxID=658473 RepID=A0A8H6TQX5_MYCCL|nr:hypothetical protein HMN09_00210700 [Mycena chlorophos]
MKNFAIACLAFVLAASGVTASFLALPSSARAAGVVMLGSDPDSNWAVGYDKDFKEVTRIWTPPTERIAAGAPGTRCRALSVSELQGLPVWPEMQKYARDNWGSGSYNIYLGDVRWKQRWGPDCMGLHAGRKHPDVSQRRVSILRSICVCAQGFVANPVCTNVTGDTGGVFSGTGGSVEVTVSSVQTTSGSYSVTKSSTIGVGFSTTLTVGEPKVFSISATISSSFSFTNTEGRTFSTSTSNQITNSYLIDTPAGKTCRLTYKQQTCYESVEGDVPFTAKGSVTFGFNSPTKGHYYWTVGFDSFDPSKYTSTTKIRGSISGQTRGDYTGICT